MSYYNEATTRQNPFALPDRVQINNNVITSLMHLLTVQLNASTRVTRRPEHPRSLPDFLSSVQSLNTSTDVFTFVSRQYQPGEALQHRDSNSQRTATSLLPALKLLLEL